jgi:phospholipid/cholesterol/gamma-HCH transport system ATP-binding protein
MPPAAEPTADQHATERAHKDDPIVRFDRVHKAFGKLVVLDGLSLDVRRGETTVILGPSGTGKSVLLKHIVGLVRPDAGSVWFDGSRIDKLSERRFAWVRRRVGFLFQQSALFDSMTVAENLEFPLREHTTLDREARMEKVEAALERVDLAGIEAQYPAQLSGGQRKRVALARAIILEPELILYDEPTTGLDPIRAAEIDRLIVRLKTDLGVSGLVVTHDLTSAERVGDRIILLHKGRVAADGTLDELRDSDDDTVQAFLSASEETLKDAPAGATGA